MNEPKPIASTENAVGSRPKTIGLVTIVLKILPQKKRRRPNAWRTAGAKDRRALGSQEEKKMASSGRLQGQKNTRLTWRVARNTAK